MTEEVQLLTDVIDMAKEPEERGYHSERYQKTLAALEARISTAYMNAENDARAVPSHPRDEEAINVVIQRRLFLGAIWIYFMRMARHLSGVSTIVTSILGDVFDDKVMGLSALKRGNLPFALFVLGIEATTEVRRRQVLDLIDRVTGTAKELVHGLHSDLILSMSPSTLIQVTDMLKTAWAFDDLHVGNDAERHLDYRHKLHLVFTASEVLPALV